jgi:SAM-dependent methyltransferase
VDAAQVRRGQRVLDVGTGSGAVAIAAAEIGGLVVGVDITDAWFGEARRRAEEAGVEIDLRTGDAEELPMDDGSYDVVLSSFAATLAPRHELVAAELARVCRPGGTVGLTAWTDSGPGFRITSALVANLPPSPAFVTSMYRWADVGYIQDRFARHGVTFRVEQRALTIDTSSVEEFEHTLLNNGPLVQARAALEVDGRWDATYQAFHEVVLDVNEVDDGTFRSTWPYLVAVGRKAAR